MQINLDMYLYHYAAASGTAAPSSVTPFSCSSEIIFWMLSRKLSMVGNAFSSKTQRQGLINTSICHTPNRMVMKLTINKMGIRMEDSKRVHTYSRNCMSLWMMNYNRVNNWLQKIFSMRLQEVFLPCMECKSWDTKTYKTRGCRRHHALEQQMMTWMKAFI